MIVLQHLKCQFGNILFQLIAGSYFAKQLHADYYYASYDTHEINFNSDYDYILKNFKKYNYNTQNVHLDENLIKMELDFNYQEMPYYDDKNYELRGYFQNWKYINYEYALNVISPSMSIINKINDIMPIYKINNSIGIHLRLKEYKDIYENFINDENRLIKFINENKDKQILIFTDDVNYIKNLNKYDNVIIFSELTNSFLLDFYTLTMCKTLVGGVSTFFIWALYLNLLHPKIYYIKEAYNFYEWQGNKFNAPNYIYNNYNFNPSLMQII